MEFYRKMSNVECISGKKSVYVKLMLHILTFSFFCHELAFQEHIMVTKSTKFPINRTHKLFNKT